MDFRAFFIILPALLAISLILARRPDLFSSFEGGSANA